MKRAKETNAKNGFSFISYMCVMDLFCSIFYIVKGWKMLTHITEQVNNEFWSCEGEGESARKRLSFNFFFFTYKQKKIGTYVRHRIWVLIIYPSIIMKFSRLTKKKIEERKTKRQATKQPSIVCVLIYDAFLSKWCISCLYTTQDWWHSAVTLCRQV